MKSVRFTNKVKKKIFSLVLAGAMVVSSFQGVDTSYASAKTVETTAEQENVQAKASNETVAQIAATTDVASTLAATADVKSNQSQVEKVSASAGQSTNVMTVFYKNGGYNYMHYKVGNGAWTNAPGVKMDDSKVFGGYFELTIDLGKESTVTACFNDGKGNWDNNDKKNYVLKAGSNYKIKSKSVSATKATAVPKPVKKTELSFVNSLTQWSDVYAYVWNSTEDYNIFDATSDSNDIYNFTIEGDYKYVLFKNLGTTDNWDQQTADLIMPESGLTFVPQGNYNFTNGSWETSVVTVAPATTAPVTPTVEPTEIPEGKTIFFNNAVSNWSEVYAYAWNSTEDHDIYSSESEANNVYKFNITGAYKYVLFKNINSQDEWELQTADLEMPTNDNNTFVAYSSDNMSNGRWYNQVAEPTAAPGKKAIVYYKAKDVNIFKSVYIHYKVGNGTWTNIPGVKMTASNISGYKWMYTIDLGNENNATVCFNNGEPKKTWDSDNGNNYHVEAGAYGIYAGKVKSISVFTAAPTKVPTAVPTNTPVPVYTTIKFNNSVSNWNEVYAYVWNNTEDYAVFAPVSISDNIYKFEITGSYTRVLFKNLNSTTDWDQQTADTYMPVTAANTFIAESNSNKSVGKWYEEGSATTTPIITSTPSPANKTIYFNNTVSKWNAAYAYVWNNTEDYKVFAPVSVSNNIYKFEITGSYAKVLFKNLNSTTAWDKQTMDKDMPTTDKNIFVAYSQDNKSDGKWYAEGGVATATPVVPTATPVSHTVDGVTVVAFNNANVKWNEVYAYVWNNTEDYKIFKPAYTLNTNKVYIFNIEGKYSKILFKNLYSTENWDRQTADLDMPTKHAQMFEPNNNQPATGNWKNSVVVNRTPIVPTIEGSIDELELGDSVKLDFKSKYEQEDYRDSRSLVAVYEDGTKEVVNNNRFEENFEKTGKYEYTYLFEPSKVGVVTLTYEVSEFEEHGEASQPITINVIAPEVHNYITVYYKNTNLKNVNIHYGVDGSWTASPGKKMQKSDRSDYSWMYTIDLGEATSAFVCFNNGSGTWDNNNGSNYKLKEGVYGVKGGKVYALN